MKIIFLGNFEAEFSSENYYKKTLLKLGHDVICLQEGRTKKEEILSHDADLFFWVHTHGWKTEGIESILSEFRNRGVISFAYHLDLYMGIARETQLHSNAFFKVDHFFTVDMLMADWLNQNTQCKGHFLPAGVFEDECFTGIANREKYPHEIIFTGSKGYHHEWPYRPKLINWLHDTFGDRFGHYGGGGKPSIRGGELNNLYASAKIVIGDTLCKDFSYPWYSSDRLFECQGRGAFSIYPRIKGLETFYTDGEEIVFYDFNDFGQLKDKIEFYLERDHERQTIVSRAMERTKSEHTYTNRLDTIINTLQNSI